VSTPEGHSIPSRTHACPVPGCKQTVVYSKLMCWLHWQYVPKKIKALVYSSWNDGQPLPAHPRHCADAVDAVVAGVKVSSN
jgi:hypothetical protein